MSADPIYDGVRDGLSIYGYARNNPLVYRDPNGLEAKKTWKDIGAEFKQGQVKKGIGDTLHKIFGKDDKKTDSTGNGTKTNSPKKDSAVNTKVDNSVKRYGDDAGLNYATKDIADAMKDAGSEYNKKTGFNIFSGDFSLEGGVESVRHKSPKDGKVWDHKGWSVDLKFGTDDGSSGAGNCFDTDSHYSASNTVDMLDIIKSSAESHNLRIYYAIFNDANVTESLTNIRFLDISGHKNHIHIEFRPKLK